MAKVKIFQFAKENDLSSSALLELVRGMGFEVKSHMSTLEDGQQEAVRQKLKTKREEVKQDYARKTKMSTPAKEEEPDLVVAEKEKIKKTTKVYNNFAALGGKKKKKKKRDKISTEGQAQAKENVRKIMAKIGGGEKKKKYRKEDKVEQEGVESKSKLQVSEYVSVSELAKMMEKGSSEVMAKCLELGLMITINQRLDFDTISLIADEFAFEAELMAEYTEEEIGVQEEEEKGEQVPRPPVVTVMGHVDHGKTSLLDYIRETNVISGEAGGITQHIGAYSVETAHGKVTFLDTPGHEAFTAMRARGAQVTDVVVLIVAADSGVMPQTREAIDHAKAGNVPLVVAINKIDLPGANVDNIKGQLAQYNVLVEEYGGSVQAVPVSAKTGENVNKLLELLALETDMLELKACPEIKGRGVIVESELSKGMGPVATVLIQNGTLRVGDPFLVGVHSGRVRTMLNDKGQNVSEAGPSIPVRVLGLDGVPQAGDSFTVMDSDKEAREIASKRRQAKHEHDIRQISVTLDNWSSRINMGDVKELPLIIKGDVDGSVEALSTQLEQLSTEEVKVRVIHKSVGAIKEADINLASASNAVIIGFHIRPNSKIRDYAAEEGIEIRLYRVIYEAVEEIKKAMTGLLSPIEKEKITGRATVRQLFKISRIGVIAGSMVSSGSIKRGAKARIIRDDIEIAETTISGLKRIKDDVREVQSGFECGILLFDFKDIKVGDEIETYEIEQIARTTL